MRAAAFTLVVTLSLVGCAERDIHPTVTHLTRIPAANTPQPVGESAPLVRASSAPTRPTPVRSSTTPRQAEAQLAPTAVPPPVLGVASVKARIAAAWPGPNDAEAIAVVDCESVHEFRASMHDYVTERRGPSKSRTTYHSMWQFDLPTWGNAFGIADPHNATVEQQTARAFEVYQARGWAPWPRCGKARFGPR